MKTFGIAAKAVIINQEKKFLVLKKSSSEDINPNTYDFPGGRVEFGEMLEEAVVREVKEETGYNVTPITVFNGWTFVKDDTFQLAGVDFICKLDDGVPSLSGEHISIEWLDLETVLKMNEIPKWMIATLTKAEKFVEALQINA